MSKGFTHLFHTILVFSRLNAICENAAPTWRASDQYNTAVVPLLGELRRELVMVGSLAASEAAIPAQQRARPVR
jgi:hypothetical protein